MQIDSKLSSRITFCLGFLCTGISSANLLHSYSWTHGSFNLTFSVKMSIYLYGAYKIKEREFSYPKPDVSVHRTCVALPEILILFGLVLKQKHSLISFPSLRSIL